MATLAASNKVELALRIVEGQGELARELIPKLCTPQHVKIAGKLIEQNSLDPDAFPDVILLMKKMSLSHFAQGEDWELTKLVEMFIGDDTMMAMLLTALAEKCVSSIQTNGKTCDI